MYFLVWIVWLLFQSFFPITVPVVNASPVPVSKDKADDNGDMTSMEIPSFVLDYAPLVWLHSEDPYRPSAIQAQLTHTTPQFNWTTIREAPSPLTLDNLDTLNDYGNESVFLTSREMIDATPQPEWFGGIMPDANGRVGGGGHEVASVVVTRAYPGIDGEEIVDAFYFYFYAYSQGNTVLGMEFGDHIGDWEHNMIRFQNGEPQALWYSQHAAGQAFKYDALEKQDDKRPYAFSGNGTHAVYATVGKHDHTIPGLNLPDGLLVDQTDKGVLWDPIKNAYAYSFNDTTNTFTPYDCTYPVNWLNFNGRWGDDALPDGPEFLGQKKYTAGPNGPKFKHLVREGVCPSKPCLVHRFRSWENGDGFERKSVTSQRPMGMEV